MELREYLFKNRIHIKDFAEALHYDRNTVGKIVNGRLKATDKFKKMVCEETDGLVSWKDWPDVKNHSEVNHCSMCSVGCD